MMEEARAQSMLPGALLLLGVGALLPWPCSLQSRPNWRSGPAQVVIPRKAPSGGGAFEVSRGLSYSLRLEGHTHIIRLQPKQLLVSRHLPVFTYTEQRALHEDQPFVQDDCYHHGYVEGIPESLVVLSTCLGAFRGMLQMNDLTYEIEPIRHSTTFEHQLYKIDSKETQFPPMKCGLTEEEIQRQKLEFQAENSKLQKSSTEGWWTHWPFVELVVVMDNYSFNYSNRNVSKATEDILNVINLVDSIYLQLGLHVSLTGIEIWNQGNLIDVEQDISQLLDSFSQWKSVHLYPRLPHDSGHLFVGKDFSNVFGLAWISGICYPQFGTAVCKFLKEDFFHFAVIIAHQLGHNLGMPHTEEFCFCRKKHCIMNAYNTNTNVFSNCSYGSYFNLTNHRGVCLKNTPTSRNISPMKQCGNKVVEGEEECDCGSEWQCRKDPCCGSDCKLRPRADCAFGLCCIKCKFASPGKLCRAHISECDLPEWCNGSSGRCPEDFYVQDGTPCGDSAYCYHKMCNSHNKQCQYIFGQTARSASLNCYRTINMQGDRFGHCGMDGLTYKRCPLSNILCGRVQCENIETIPNLKQHNTIIQKSVNGTKCWGMDYHFGVDIADIGQVKDGTLCGLGKICMRRSCVNYSILNYDCKLEKCHKRGVCNNKKHCHCRYGWAPPYCEFTGYGGSSDSGPAPKGSLLPPLLTILYTVTLFTLFFLASISYVFIKVLCF